MVTEGLLRRLTIPWKLLCQVMAVLGHLGEALKARTAGRLGQKKAFGSSWPFTSLEKGMVSGLGR